MDVIQSVCELKAFTPCMTIKEQSNCPNMPFSSLFPIVTCQCTVCTFAAGLKLDQMRRVVLIACADRHSPNNNVDTSHTARAGQRSQAVQCSPVTASIISSSMQCPPQYVDNDPTMSSCLLCRLSHSLHALSAPPNATTDATAAEAAMQ